MLHLIGCQGLFPEKRANKFDITAGGVFSETLLSNFFDVTASHLGQSNSFPELLSDSSVLHSDADKVHCNSPPPFTPQSLHVYRRY